MAHRHASTVRRLIVAATLAVPTLLLSLPASAEPADAVTGTWLTEPGDRGGRAKVEVRKEGNQYVGRIVWLEEPEYPAGPKQGQPKVDEENPDEALRDRPVVGLAIVSAMTYAGDGSWSGGTVYDPSNGKTYSATMSLDGVDDKTLELHGYVGIPLFGRTSTWRRIE